MLWQYWQRLIGCTKGATSRQRVALALPRSGGTGFASVCRIMHGTLAATWGFVRLRRQGRRARWASTGIASATQYLPSTLLVGCALVGSGCRANALRIETAKLVHHSDLLRGGKFGEDREAEHFSGRSFRFR